MTNNAVAERQSFTLPERLERRRDEFSKALPGHISADKFIRTAQTAVQMNPDITQACHTVSGMKSLMSACTKAATDGLILDGREAALVTFNSKVSRNPDVWEKQVQYIPMVAGLMKKARNSGEISSIAAHVVYENDAFEYVLGDEERITHTPKFGARGKAVAVYAIVKLKDGSVQREVMDEHQVMMIAGQSKNAYQYDQAKGKNYGEWWRNTVIRRISKYLPSSSDKDEFLNAVSRIDDDYEYEIDGDTGADKPAPTKKRGAGAETLKNVTPKTDDDNSQEQRPHDAQTGEILDHDNHAKQSGDDI